MNAFYRRVAAISAVVVIGLASFGSAALAALPTFKDVVSIIPNSLLDLFDRFQKLDFNPAPVEKTLPQAAQNLAQSHQSVAEFLKTLWAKFIEVLRVVGSILFWPINQISRFFYNIITTRQ